MKAINACFASGAPLNKLKRLKMIHQCDECGYSSEDDEEFQIVFEDLEPVIKCYDCHTE